MHVFFFQISTLPQQIYGDLSLVWVFYAVKQHFKANKFFHFIFFKRTAKHGTRAAGIFRAQTEISVHRDMQLHIARVQKDKRA